jgi:hypothetical protein
MVQEQRGDLRDREDEDQVPEELDRARETISPFDVCVYLFELGLRLCRERCSWARWERFL